MSIHIIRGLEHIGPVVAESITETLKEREEMGISVPGEFYTTVSYHAAENGKASARLTNQGPLMNVSVMPLVEGKTKLSPDDLGFLFEYFDIARRFLWGGGDVNVIEVIKEPLVTIRGFEQHVESRCQGGLAAYKTGYEERGSDYDKHRKALVRNAKRARGLLAQVREDSKSIKPSDLDSVRHEIDHVDFFGMPLYLQRCRLVNEKTQAQLSFQAGEISSPDLQEQLQDMEKP